MEVKYLALLRGINVSGKKPIKMKEFQTHLMHDGFENVRTYIQSGNIVFNYKKTENEIIESRIVDIIKNKYGYDVPVIVLTASELEDVTKNNPFVHQAATEPSKVMVSFLSNTPKADLILKLESLEFETEKFKAINKCVFLYCRNGIGKAKINNNYLESKLKVSATTRNWKTVLKLFEMMNED